MTLIILSAAVFFVFRIHSIYLFAAKLSVCECCRTTASMNYIRKLTRLRVVDNSNIGRAAELAGKPAKCIHIYNKTGVGYLGDKVLPDFLISCG